MNKLASILIVAGVAFGCTSPTVDPEELLAADRKFQIETAERGAAGWVEAFAVDGKLIAAGTVIEGHDAIGDVMAVLDRAGYSLTWEPEFAEGSKILATPTGATGAR